jgi:hypothetical protein
MQVDGDGDLGIQMVSDEQQGRATEVVVPCKVLAEKLLAMVTVAVLGALNNMMTVASQPRIGSRHNYFV